MEQIAKNNNGHCVSTKYIDCNTSLKWKCSKGHTWEMLPTKVKNSNLWCPYCGGFAKPTIKDMQKLALSKGGKCLSNKYVNNRTELKWKCKYDHVWESAPTNISSGSWCPYCVGKGKTIEDMKKVAKCRNGQCLSTKYQTRHIKLKWKCKFNHIWEATYSSIHTGAWCPYCGGNAKGTIDELKDIAKKKGGKCLSKEYKTAHTKLKFKCKKGHIFEASPDNVKHGMWCRYCAGRGKTIKDFQRFAGKKDGICLSKAYKGPKIKLRYRCKYDHIWEALPFNIIKGHWCAICAGQEKHTLEFMEEVAKSKGGHCISKEYINSASNLKWKCKYNHIWEACYNSIRFGSWCPICMSGVRERICRLYFERLFKKKFRKCYPDWLVGPKGSKLELDGYNEKLGIAFEHQGVQHYKDTPFFGLNNLKYRKKIDIIKKRLCKNKKVKLIIIPYRIDKNNLQSYIVSQCNKKKIKLPKYIKNIPIEDLDIYPTNMLEELKEIAIKKGGLCLSKNYIDARSKLSFKCNKGHEWSAIPDSIKRGSWCPYCSNRMPLTLHEVQKLAKKRKGKCLSKEYVNAQEKLTWQCKNKHIWQATWNNIKKGSWCLECQGKTRYSIKYIKQVAKSNQCISLSNTYQSNSKLKWKCKKGHIWEAKLVNIIDKTVWCPFCDGRNPLTIQDMQKLAKNKKGKCLSKKYVTARSKLKWECQKGHNWKAIPDAIKRGSWCPYCAGKHITISDLQKNAKERGGKCLSKQYINAHTKLKWKCKNGHIWYARPNSIRSGQWCPICAKIRR